MRTFSLKWPTSIGGSFASRENRPFPTSPDLLTYRDHKAFPDWKAPALRIDLESPDHQTVPGSTWVRGPKELIEALDMNLSKQAKTIYRKITYAALREHETQLLVVIA